MKLVVCVMLQAMYVAGAIRKSPMMNKLVKVKPVGPVVVKKFIPLTEIPPPAEPHPHVHMDGRRHFEDCSPTPAIHEVVDGATVDIFGEYYDDHMAKTVATVIIPDHIDRLHFEVTTEVPYLTVGPIDGMGFHPSIAPKLDPCEQIYQDHLNEQYSEEVSETHSEESLEMVRVPVAALKNDAEEEQTVFDVYDDMKR